MPLLQPTTRGPKLRPDFLDKLSCRVQQCRFHCGLFCSCSVPPTHVPLVGGTWALLPAVIKWLLQGRVATFVFTSASARAKSSNHYPPVSRSQQEKKKEAASRTCTAGHFFQLTSIKSARKRVRCVSSEPRHIIGI